MSRLGVWLFSLTVGALTVRGLVALSRTDGVSDGLLGILTFGLCLGAVWTIYMREERDS